MLNALRYEDSIREFSQSIKDENTEPKEIYDVVCPHLPEFTWECAPISEIADCALRVLIEHDLVNVKDEKDAQVVLMLVKVKNADAECVDVTSYWENPEE